MQNLALKGLSITDVDILLSVLVSTQASRVDDLFTNYTDTKNDHYR